MRHAESVTQERGVLPSIKKSIPPHLNVTYVKSVLRTRMDYLGTESSTHRKKEKRKNLLSAMSVPKNSEETKT